MENQLEEFLDKVKDRRIGKEVGVAFGALGRSIFTRGVNFKEFIRNYVESGEYLIDDPGDFSVKDLYSSLNSSCLSRLVSYDAVKLEIGLEMEKLGLSSHRGISQTSRIGLLRRGYNVRTFENAAKALREYLKEDWNK